MVSSFILAHRGWHQGARGSQQGAAGPLRGPASATSAAMHRRSVANNIRGLSTTGGEPVMGERLLCVCFAVFFVFFSSSVRAAQTDSSLTPSQPRVNNPRLPGEIIAERALVMTLPPTEFRRAPRPGMTIDCHHTQVTLAF